MAEKKKYECTRTRRFYPGRLSEERIKQLANREVEVDDITIDDIVHSLAKTRTVDLHLMTDVIRQKWGDQAAREFVHEWARRHARAGMESWLKRNKVSHGTPELMAEYQDLAHAVGGPAHATTFAEYDDEKCIVRRTQCVYYTFRPEGMESFCPLATEGFMQGYKEADPAFSHAEKPACLGFGDPEGF